MKTEIGQVMNAVSVHCCMNVEPLEKEPRSYPEANANGLRKKTGSTLKFKYAKAPSGVDSNLLILLHGLGGRAEPFFELGCMLQQTLPQTAILSAQGAKQVPLLDEDAWMWWTSFDMLGELLPNPNPTLAIQDIHALLEYLTASVDDGGCGWNATHVHIFGFGQGGSLALEAVINPGCKNIGSVVSISGPLLSFPSFSPALQIPVCFLTRIPPAILKSAPQAKSHLVALRRAFKHVDHLNFPPNGTSTEERMVSGSEWRDVCAFWAKFWRNRSDWELSGELYKVQ